MPIPQFNEKFNSENSIKALEMLLNNNKVSDISELPKAPTNCIFSPLTKIRPAIEEKVGLKRGPGIIEPILISDNIATYCNFVGFGAPMWSWIFEQLIAYGIKNFIYVGVFGKVNSKYDNESIYVVEKALRDEGVSYHYLKDDDKWSYPNNELTQKLINNGAKPISIWTTDCMFRQTFAEIDYACQNDIAGFEMECSALFAVAKEKGVKIASLQVVSDYYLDDKHTSIFNTEPCINNLNKAIELALKVLR